MLTQETFDELRRIIKNYSGINFEDRKKYFVENRVSQHMKELGITSIKDYLLTLRLSQERVRELVSKCTVNETYFYREFYQLEAFAELLPQMAARRRKVRILSIPCSTGEEPYTLAIVTNEILGDLNRVEIVGVDIDYVALKRAQEGIYSDRSVSKLPDKYLQKYFSRNGNGWEIKPLLKKAVKFIEGNILDRRFMRSLGRFEFVFCKNLLIYFDTKEQRIAAAHLYDVLSEDGYLFLGHAESMSRISSTFRPVKVKGAILYQKETEEDEE
ncbi:MAG: chemotaxis protein [Deltaproteobacteria bacterium]|nr:MAG: chemotaxis protein [Deltaproteobacteria bacterium]